MINLDANATYGLLPEVAAEIAPVMAELSSGKLLNPSSIHQGGQRARLVLEEARDAVRALFGAGPKVEVVFTSGATEGNNWILQALGRGSTGVACSQFEHASVIDTVKALGQAGIPTHFFGLNSAGHFDPEEIVSTLPHSTALLSCMCANNETGEVFPISALAAKARNKIPHLFLHTDAVQAAGKLELSWGDLSVDAAVISAHKLGGLTGVGAVLLNPGHQLTPLLYGGPQESRHRAGTENILGIASLGAACRIALRDRAQRIAAMRQRVAALKGALQSSLPQLTIIRDGVPTLPNTISVHIPGVRSDDLVVAADLKGVAISAGSACASGKQLPSHVLLAVGLSEEQARECVRLSVSAEDTIDSVTQAASVLAELMTKRVQG
jgi:cysteine desulfurase